MAPICNNSPEKTKDLLNTTNAISGHKADKKTAKIITATKK